MMNSNQRSTRLLTWMLSALLPAVTLGMILPADSHAAAARPAASAPAAQRPASSRASASARRPNSRASRYLASITPRATRANADARARRQASGASATVPAANRRNGIRLEAPPFARWSAWNRASAPMPSAAARPQRERRSASGMRVRFRAQPAQTRR